MARISDFPIPTNDDQCTVCERNGVLLGAECSGNLFDFTRTPLKASPTKTPSLSCTEFCPKKVFLDNVDQQFSEKLKGRWDKDGLLGIGAEIMSHKKAPETLKVVASWMGSCIGRLKSLRDTIISLRSNTAASEFSCDEKLSLDTATIASHRHLRKLAIAMQDGTIRLLDLSSTVSADDKETILNDKRHRGVQCLSWRPCSSLSFAVGCESGALVWLLDPSANLTRPSANMSRLLATSSPVTSISWNRTGLQLALARQNSSTFTIWDLVSNTVTDVQRKGASLSSLSWSPCGERLLTLTNSNMFRIWETETWTCEKFVDLKGRCKEAAWSPCGKVLLFSVAGDHVIYYIQFYDRKGKSPIDVAGSGVATKCADTASYTWETEERSIDAGGEIASMAWDPTGTRLVVAFEDENGTMQSNIALYCVALKPLVQLIPCGFIRGKYDETPLSMGFVHGYDKGALLSMIWSGHTISTIPLLFSTASTDFSTAEDTTANTIADRTLGNETLHVNTMSDSVLGLLDGTINSSQLYSVSE